MDYKIKSLILIVLSFVAFVTISPHVLAQGTYSCTFTTENTCVLNEENNCGDGYFPGTCSGNDSTECLSSAGQCLGGPPLASKVSNLYNFALGAGVILALGIFIYAGVRYAASGGSSSVVGEAKKWMAAAVFGLAILFGSYLFLQTINPSLLTLEDPTTPQNPPGQWSPPGITIHEQTDWLTSCVDRGETRDECERAFAQSRISACRDTGGSADDCENRCVADLSTAITNAFDFSTGAMSPSDTARALCDEYSRAYESQNCIASGEACTIGSTACCGESSCVNNVCRPGTQQVASFNQTQQAGLLEACGQSGDNNYSGCVWNASTTRFTGCSFFQYSDGGRKITCTNSGGDAFTTNPWCSTCGGSAGGVLSECINYASQNNSGCCSVTPGACSQ